MNNREEWSDTERSIQTMIERIQKEYPDFWKESPSPSEDIRYLKRYQKKLRNRKRRMNMAACFACIVIFGSGMALWLDSSAAYGVKFALEKKYFEVTGLVSATDPERVSDENSMSVTIKDESQIETYKKFWDGLMIPGYIPEGYEFQELNLEKYKNGMVVAEYIYKNKKNILTILLNSPGIKDNKILWLISDEVRNGENSYYIWNDSIAESVGINVMFDDKNIIVNGCLTENDLFKIINKME